MHILYLIFKTTLGEKFIHQYFCRTCSVKGHRRETANSTHAIFATYLELTLLSEEKAPKQQTNTQNKYRVLYKGAVGQEYYKAKIQADTHRGIYLREGVRQEPSEEAMFDENK